MLEGVSSKFTCKCGKVSCYISHGKVTHPCPECGKRYSIDKKKLNIVGDEV